VYDPSTRRQGGIWNPAGPTVDPAGGAMLRASAGGLVFGPRGTPHAFQNIGETPGRLLAITTPSGLERFFEQFAALLPGPASPEALIAVGHANWVEITGPPVGVSDPL
jgi:hypothetical protein